MRVRSAHPSVGRLAAIGATCLAMAATGMVATVQVAEAATIPVNPCVTPVPRPVTTTPVLTRLSVSPKVVDVRRHPKTLVVTLTARDTLAIRRIIVTVARGPRRAFSIGADAHLVSGTATDGTWRAAIAVKRFIPDGPFRVRLVRLWDVGGGFAYVSAAMLQRSGWPGKFTVRSQTDRTAPTVSGFHVSTRAVDTTTAARAITLRVTARDDLTGVARVRVIAHGTDAALVPAQAAYRGFDVRLARSSTRPHQWRGRVVVPTWAGTSRWQISLRVRDARGHVRRLSTAALSSRGWQSSLHVTSRRDPAQPTLAAVSFSPTTFDARSGAVRVDVTFRVTDPLSGPADRATFMFKGDRTGAADMVITSITGPPTDRTYHGYAIVSRCGAALSTWRAMIDLYDNATNENWVGPYELASLGFPYKLEVRQYDTLAPFVSSIDGLLAGQSLTLRFTEPVLLAAPMAGTLAVTVDRAPAAGSWQCRDGTDQVVVCDADGADVVEASFTPTTPFEAGDELTVRPVAEYPATTGIYDLDGVPMRTFTVLRTVS